MLTFRHSNEDAKLFKRHDLYTSLSPISKIDLFYKFNPLDRLVRFVYRG
tara:strand:- start:150 stop:296 length:147 start_codon:yes stop_codon:yes gene_type:complete